MDGQRGKVTKFVQVFKRELIWNPLRKGGSGKERGE